MTVVFAILGAVIATATTTTRARQSLSSDHPMFCMQKVVHHLFKVLELQTKWRKMSSISDTFCVWEHHPSLECVSSGELARIV